MSSPQPDAREGVVTFGETMALVSGVSYGPLQHSKTMTLSIGGAESNVAIALTRLGERATWIGKVGTDPFGDLVAREITAEGVQTVVSRDAEAPTGVMFKERRTAAETRVWYYRAGSAGSRLTIDDIDAEMIRSARILHVTGISPALSSEMAQLTDTAVEIAREAGTVVSLDLNYRSRLWSRAEAAATYRALIPRADVVFGGDEEAAIALGREDTPLGLAHGLIELGAKEAVVKLGALGVVAVAGGESFRQAAVPIEPVDTVGAGDAFVAGYLAEHLRGEPMPVRLRTGVMVGAYACLVSGDWEGLPRRQELQALTAREPVQR